MGEVGRSRAGALARDSRGSSAVEFAILAPMLVLMAAGMLVFGLYLGAVHCVQELASEAARASVAGVTERERSTLARQQVNRSIASYGLLSSDKLEVTAASDPADPDMFTVTLAYDASRLGLASFASLLSIPSSRLVRSASVRRGGT